MKKQLLALAVAALFGQRSIRRGAFNTRDAAFLGRMGAGSPGEVNRTHPASIEPGKIGTVPPTQYGMPLLNDGSNGLRMFQAGDTAVTLAWGTIVRPYPTQQVSGGMSAAFGAGAPPTTGPIDTMRSGYMTVQLNPGAVAGGSSVAKGAPVFIWCAASDADHTQGGYEIEATGGSTAALDPDVYAYNGPSDASGVIEISVRP